MMGLRRDLPVPATAVDIQLWSNCLASQPGVLQVLPVVDGDGRSRKSPTPGHLCPYELYCYIDHAIKKHRITTGLTNHGGTLHVYVRAPSSRLTASEIKRVREVFDGASARLVQLAAAVASSAGPPPAPPTPVALPKGIPPPPPPPTQAPPQPVEVKTFICPETKQKYVAEVDIFGEFTGRWDWCGDLEHL